MRNKHLLSGSRSVCPHYQICTIRWINKLSLYVHNGFIVYDASLKIFQAKAEVKSDAVLGHMTKMQHSDWFVMGCCLPLHDAGHVPLLIRLLFGIFKLIIVSYLSQIMHIPLKKQFFSLSK